MNQSAIRRGLIGLAAVAAVSVGGVMATAGAAQASTSRSGCTVTPLKPIFAGQNSSGINMADYQIKVTCNADRSATIQQRLFEQDTQVNPFEPDDPLSGTLSHTYSPGSAQGSTIIHTIRAVPDTDWWLGDDTEELYHSVRFRVTSHGVTSPWTAWEASPVREMQQ